MIIKKLVLATFLLPSFVWAADCTPAPPASPELVFTRAGIFTLKGELANFDPCHASVTLNGVDSTGRTLRPLAILVHGGGGMGDVGAYEKWFTQFGLATLKFDAYQMNIPDKASIPGFTATKMSNESRQRMIFKVALGAYRWVLKQPGVDTSRIYLYGISNGAPVVANLAALADPANVKRAFAEGMPGAGIGMPDKLRVPLTVIYGKKDNYGGLSETSWMYERRSPCTFNATMPELPDGTSKDCNSDKTRDDGNSIGPKSQLLVEMYRTFYNSYESATASEQKLLAAQQLVESVNTGPLGMFFKQAESPIAWYERQKASGAPIEIWWFENAGHGIAQPIKEIKRAFGNRSESSNLMGGDEQARKDYFSRLRNAVSENVKTN